MPHWLRFAHNNIRPQMNADQRRSAFIRVYRRLTKALHTGTAGDLASNCRAPRNLFAGDWVRIVKRTGRPPLLTNWLRIAEPVLATGNWVRIVKRARRPGNAGDFGAG